ncbi:MAG: hypothetical protein NTY19_36650 [Planctomycetota bacterium]|nr:hypothetical protein [Planctomycetota bacterium]
MTLTLTARDHDLLETLTGRVRLFPLHLAAKVWWPEARNQGTARRRLELLAKAGWIECHIINAHPLLPVRRPLFTWEPGQEDPDAERIACESRARWSQPARPTSVCVASPMAACLLGSTARRLPPPEHRDHDLRLAAVYVHYRVALPRLAKLWIGEHALPKAGYRIKDPDAFLCDANGRVLRVIESAGRNSASQIDRFHEHCVELDLPYELW